MKMRDSFGCFLPICVYIGIGVAILTKNLMIIPILLLCTSILCFFYCTIQKKDIAKIKNIHTYKIKDIVNICNAVKSEMGKGGYFNMMVAVEGFVKGDSSQVYVAINVFGNEFTNINVKDKQFYVEDGTGTILVKVDKLPFFHNRKGNPVINEDRLIDIAGVADGSVYILGEATDRTGELVIQKPKDSDNSFIVAFTHKNQYIQKHKTNFALWVFAGIINFLVGLAILVATIAK
jgi:hypothetical protein